VRYDFFIFFAQNNYMKRILLFGLIALFVLGGASKVSAQKSAGGSDYTNALGLGIDFGDGATLVGVSGKHFFSENNVGMAEVLFGNHVTAIHAFYQYHKGFEGAEGLKWFAGVGPSILLYNGGSNFSIVPMAGLDYKITNIPLAFSFDWRPRITVTHGGDFSAARFGLGFRYAFN
jgi:hypothetical protein